MFTQMGTSGNLPFSLFPTLDLILYALLSMLMKARIAQSVEHGANNARVAGSRPAVSILFLAFFCLCSHPQYSFYALLSSLFAFFLFPSLCFLFLLPPYILFYLSRSSFLEWGLSSAVEQLTPDQPVSGSIPLALTFFALFHSPLIFLLCALLFHTSPLLLLFSSLPAFSSLISSLVFFGFSLTP